MKGFKRIYCCTVSKTAQREMAEIKIQRITPAMKGLKPIILNVLKERPVPIRNRATFSIAREKLEI